MYEIGCRSRTLDARGRGCGGDQTARRRARPLRGDADGRRPQVHRPAAHPPDVSRRNHRSLPTIRTFPSQTHQNYAIPQTPGTNFHFF